MFKKIYYLGEKVIYSLENSRAPFIYFILTFFFALTLRNFIEPFSDSTSFRPRFILHFTSAYTALALVLIIVFYIATREEIAKLIKVILPSFIILSSAPLIDLALSGGKGFNMSYLLPGHHPDILLRFLTFGGDFSKAGVTPGMRIEGVLILVGCFFYFKIKTSHILKSLFFTLITYAAIFFWGATPFVVKGLLEFMGISYRYSDQLLTHFFLLIILLGLIPVAYLSNKTYFKVIIKDIRLFRIIHYELMFAAGVVIGSQYQTLRLNSINIFYFIFIPASILFAALFSIVFNNTEDINVDKISNQDRPLIKSAIGIKDYKNLGWVFLFFALVYAGASGFNSLFLVAFTIGCYFLYSMPPLRFKRIPFFSKFTVALTSLAIFLLGFLIKGGTLERFPGKITAFILIGITAASNFIDIKDFKGDKSAGIKTLPVIIGLAWAKRILGFFFFLAYLSVYFILKNNYLLIPLLGFGIFQFLLINRTKYDERPVFILYLLSLAAGVIYIAAAKVAV